MSVQLYNDTSSIKLVRGTDVYNIDRSCDLRIYGQELHITSNGGKSYYVVNFSDVTVPVVANIEALRVTVEAWKEDSITATIDTTPFTDGSQKTQIVDSSGDNLGTDANPIVVTTSTSEQGVSTFQEQYTQTDLLNLMLIELQEINKTLKKIYQ